MKEVLLVDGYNIIHAWPELKEISKLSLEEARHALVEIMQDFQGYKAYQIIVVFDAYMISGGLEKKLKYGQVEVVFTKENETADHYIERWADVAPKNVQVFVATSDHLQQTIELSRGAVRVSARELWDQVKSFRKEIGKIYLEKPEIRSNPLENWASPEIIEVLERWRRQR